MSDIDDQAGPEPVGTLDHVRMRVVASDPAGTIDASTVFAFAETNNLVTATYRGGAIAVGYLVGIRDRNRLTFRYAQADVAHNLDGGVSTCELVTTEGGRRRLIEHFEWQSKPGSGTNILEQIDG